MVQGHTIKFKRFYILILIAGYLVASLYGCTEKKSAKPRVLDYLTGAEQVKTYQKIKSKIKGIDQSRKEQIQEGEE